jgi:hypothetical protein
MPKRIQRQRTRGYGGRWVLHPVRRVLVWEQQW